MLMLVLMLRFYLPLLRIDLRQQPDMLMLVMASVPVLLMLVMMSRFFPPFWGLIRASRIRWRIYQSWSKDRGGSTRRPIAGSQHTFLQKRQAGRLANKNAVPKVAFCVFRLCEIGLESPTITTLPSREICSFIFLTGICRRTQLTNPSHKIQLSRALNYTLPLIWAMSKSWMINFFESVPG